MPTDDTIPIDRTMTGAELRDTFPGYRVRDDDLTVIEIPEQRGESVPAETVVRPRLAAELDFDLYTHQAEALEALATGANVCVATSTSSGKTLVYALQIARQYLDAQQRAADGGNGEATAYVIYPMKALARDQERELNDLYAELGLDITVRVYDGDTERGETRRRIRENADVIISNFAGVNTYLHNHDRWARFFRACNLIVIDESHTYTGVHGMHVAWVIRRLKRVIDYYGGDPQYVLTSATIGNPGVHSESLIGEPVSVVDTDGSPQGARELVLWNPPPRARESSGTGSDGETDHIGDDADEASETNTDDEVFERQPASIEAPRVFSHLTYHDVQTLLFTPSRKLAELSIRRANKHRADTPRYYRNLGTGRGLKPYHAGHSRATRHGTEHQLKTGLLDGVASTTALELGINIGEMEATVQMGYPGQRQSFWQQIGRAGRGTQRALSVLVADYRTIDQYILNHPAYLLENDVEDAVVDTSNDAIFAQHVLCAADELALTDADGGSFADRDRLARAVRMWRQAGRITGYLDTGVSYTGPPRPQATVSLYTTSDDQYDVRLAPDAPDDIELEMEPLTKERVLRDYHEGALRLHEGQQYEVVEVSHETPHPYIILSPVDARYYTQTRSEVTILDAESEESRDVNGFTLHFGQGTVLVYHGTYDKMDLESATPLEQGIPTDSPPLRMQTQLCWLEVPHEIETALVQKYKSFSVPALEREGEPTPVHLGYMGGLHAAEHAMIGVAPLELMLDKRDLGGLSTLTVDSHLRQDDMAMLRDDGPQSIAAAQARLRQLTAGLDRTPASGWFIYDGVEGGIGFARAIYEHFEALAERSRDHIAECACGRIDGCPACVMDEHCGNDNRPLHREAAIDVLDQVLGTETPDALTEYLPDDEYGGDRRPPMSFS